jgi:calcium-dependent protein kinase
MTFIMTNVVTQDEIKEMQNLFTKLDTDKDGRLSQQELYEGSRMCQVGFKQVYPHLDDEAINDQVANIIRNADGNQSGLVDYTEYLVIAMQKEKLLSRDKLTKAFNAFDLVESDSCRTVTV